MSTPALPETPSEVPTTTPRSKWYRRIGPGLIIACVVIGPGSITTSSQVGATHGFALTWVVLLAVVFMLTFMQMGARLGVVSSQSPLEILADKIGRPLAVLIGIGTFFISASFQFGNNLGVDAAVKELSRDVLSPESRESILPWLDYSIVAFNALAIAFLLAFKNLYRALERLMMCFVGLMLFSFALNLSFALANQAPAADLADAAAAPILDARPLGTGKQSHEGADEVVGIDHEIERQDKNRHHAEHAAQKSPHGGDQGADSIGAIHGCLLHGVLERQLAAKQAPSN